MTKKVSVSVYITLTDDMFSFLAKIRYKYRKVSEASEDDLKALGFKMKISNEEITLESEYEKLKELDIDNWEQKRGPRPWEEEQQKTQNQTK